MEKVNINDFLNFDFISNGIFNKSGNNFAYMVSKSDLKNNCYNKNIYIYNLEKHKTTQLTTNGKVISFDWYNDEKVIYIVSEDDKTVFKTININGGESNILFEMDKIVSKFKIYSEDIIVFIAEYSKKEKETDYEVLEEIPFWQNGDGFTSKKRYRLCLYKILTNDYLNISNETSNIENFIIENDEVYYIFNDFNDKMDIYNGINKFNINTNKTNYVLLQNKYNIDDVFVWNNRICALASDMLKYGLNENPKLYYVNNGSLELLINITGVPGTNINSDCRLGGGNSIKVINNELYYTSIVRDKTVLFKIDEQLVTSEILTVFEAIDFFDININNNIVLCAQKRNSIQELYIYNDKITEITNNNSNYLKDRNISPVENIKYFNNDVELDGYVIKPINFSSEKTYPCILNIHGGPKTTYGNNYFHEMQVWASEGYFVIFCNPRGSDGRGDEFSDIRGKYGTIDYDDIMAFVDFTLLAYPNIDKDKLGVTGGSYGGFMTNWIIGHTNRFKAAVSQRSISNWISKFNTTDIGYYFNHDQIMATPWDNCEKLWFHSPIKYANNVKTPTLFIHSEEDYRCWLAEGLQMFTALKYHGVESRLCLFKGENHELSRSGKPSHRIRRLQEITNWFNNYLK